MFSVLNLSLILLYRLVQSIRLFVCHSSILCFSTECHHRSIIIKQSRYRTFDSHGARPPPHLWRAVKFVFRVIIDNKTLLILILICKTIFINVNLNVFCLSKRCLRVNIRRKLRMCKVSSSQLSYVVNLIVTGRSNKTLKPRCWFI